MFKGCVDYTPAMLDLPFPLFILENLFVFHLCFNASFTTSLFYTVASLGIIFYLCELFNKDIMSKYNTKGFLVLKIDSLHSLTTSNASSKYLLESLSHSLISLMVVLSLSF
jgi:hypothetical protein